MRYVPSDAIDVDNAGKLHLKWIHQSGVVGSYENTPIVEQGVMYVTTPDNHVFAIHGYNPARGMMPGEGGGG